MDRALQERLTALGRRYDAIEAALRAVSGGPASTAIAASVALESDARDTPAVAALRRWCRAQGLHSARFAWVPSDYYEHSLSWRRDVLGAPSLQHLCKTIVLENTHCVHDDCSNRTNARFYMVVYQYVHRFDAEMVMRAIKLLNEGLGKKRFNFRLAPPETALALTGFPHGAVAPFGTVEPVPVLLSAEVLKLTPAVLWLGGGHRDCKCRVDVEEFLRVLQPIVAPLTVPLTAEELERVVD